jgi:hypothetical protein
MQTEYEQRARRQVRCKDRGDPAVCVPVVQRFGMADYLLLCTYVHVPTSTWRG